MNRVLIASLFGLLNLTATAAPTVSLTAPAANAVYAAPASITLTATATPSTGTTISKVEFYQGTTLVGTATTSPYTVTWANVPEGQYSLTASATDNSGGVSTSSAQPLTVRAGVKLYFLHTDQLGTPRLVTDESNKTVWRNTPISEPFGMSPVEEDPDGDGTPFTMNLRFPGQYFNKETNLVDNWFRMYDPSIGRYIQSDPIGLRGGINTYSYVEGNPLKYTDPTGQFAFLPGLIGGGIGGITAAMAYNSSGAPSGSMWKAVVAGAVVGAGAAYVPASWGVYGAIAAGAFGGAAGDLAGQYVGYQATSAAGQCSANSSFNWNWQATAVQGGVGAISGLTGYGAMGFAGTLNSVIPGVWNVSAVAAGTTGITQMYINLPAPAPYGGFHP